MSLLSEAMTACTVIEKTSTISSYGGQITAWSDGTSFQAALVLDTSTEARLAEAHGVRDNYTVFTSRAFPLSQGMVFRRESDGATFRVTSNGADKKTPVGAGLDISVCKAQIWEVPTND